jgi:hypothetical protein
VASDDRLRDDRFCRVANEKTRRLDRRVSI